MKRIKTDRFEKALKATVEHNSYVFSHPNSICGVGHVGMPIDEDLFDNIENIKKELEIDCQMSEKIYDMCFDCIYFESLCKGNGQIGCDAVHFEQFIIKSIENNHCRCKKLSINEVSEYEKYKEKRQNASEK